MANIQITSVSEPFDHPETGQAAVEVLGLADAVGLLPDTLKLDALDQEVVAGVLDRIRKAGIGTDLIPQLQGALETGHVRELLKRLAEVLRQNPVPDYEWKRLQRLFANDELADLLGISATSVARYRANERNTPDAVAARLHLLARIVHHLEGIYSEFGVRRWFGRPRKALEGAAPADLLQGDWDPDSKGPMSVLGLARSGNELGGAT